MSGRWEICLPDPDLSCIALFLPPPVGLPVRPFGVHLRERNVWFVSTIGRHEPHARLARASDRSSACQDQVPSGRFQTRPVLPTLQLAVVTAATTTRLASRRLACLLQTSICLGLGLDLCLPESSYSTLHPLRNVWYVPATAQPSCACTATAALNCDCTCALSHHHLIDSTRSVLVPSPPPVPSWPGPILFFGTAELRLMTHSSCLRRPACRCKFVSSAS